MGYAAWLQTQGPSWILGPQGKALARTTGAAYDAQRDRILQAVLARFPTAGQLDTSGQLQIAPSDALDEIGADRQLPRGPGESDAAYAARLQAAWDIWPFAGSHYGVLRALKGAGYVGAITVQDNGRWGQLTGSAGTIADLTLGSLMTCKDRTNNPPGWTFDPRTYFYSRMGLVFAATAANLESVSGQAILNALVNEWRPAGTAFVGTWVILAGNVLGWPLARALGGGENLGGDSVRFIPGDGSAPFVMGP